jgi:acetyl esterase/lipase
MLHLFLLQLVLQTAVVAVRFKMRNENRGAFCPTTAVEKRAIFQSGLAGGLDTAGLEPKSSYSTVDYAYADVDGASLAIRVHRPDNAGSSKTPALVCFQGSGFAGTTLDRGAGTAMWFIDHGYTVVVLPYRGADDGVTFPTPVHEVIAAIRYLRYHADHIGIDPSKIASYGGSSGGWYANMLAVSGSKRFREAGLLGAVGPEELHEVSSTVSCAIDTFGPVDFSTMDAQSVIVQGVKPECHDEADSPESKYMGFPLQENLTALAWASPLTYLGASTPPLSISHGDSDPLVPIGQSRQLVKKLEELGLVHEYKELPGAGHGTSQFGTEEHMQWTLSFLQKHCLALSGSDGGHNEQGNEDRSFVQEDVEDGGEELDDIELSFEEELNKEDREQVDDDEQSEQ